jgi:hypothetical protein
MNSPSPPSARKACCLPKVHTFLSPLFALFFEAWFVMAISVYNYGISMAFPLWYTTIWGDQNDYINGYNQLWYMVMNGL